MPPLSYRCRSCNARCPPGSQEAICDACAALAAGGRPEARAGVWRFDAMRRGVRFDRIRHIDELVEEAKSRSLLVLVIVLVLAYFMSLTSSSILMNLPIAALLVAAVRWASIELHALANQRPAPVNYEELQRRIRQVAHPDALPPPPREIPGHDKVWRRAIGSAEAEKILDNLVRGLLRHFIVDMFYSYITPDRDFPDEVRALFLSVIAELSKRVKRMNLVTLLTKDLVDLVADHLELYRRAQADIGEAALESMSAAKREESLKHSLGALGELHPACLSAEYEYKAVRKLSAAVLASCLPAAEANNRVVLCFTRELVCCCVLLPVLRLANPSFVNGLIVSFIPEPRPSASSAEASAQDPPSDTLPQATIARSADGLEKEPLRARGAISFSDRGRAAAGAGVELSARGPQAQDSAGAEAAPAEEHDETRLDAEGEPSSGDDEGDPLMRPVPRRRRSRRRRHSSVPPPERRADGPDNVGWLSDAEDDREQVPGVASSVGGDQGADAAGPRRRVGPTGAESSTFLEDYVERQMAVLADDHFDNVWSKGRRYQAKEARLQEPEGDRQAGATPPSQPGTMSAAELSGWVDRDRRGPAPGVSSRSCPDCGRVSGSVRCDCSSDAQVDLSARTAPAPAAKGSGRSSRRSAQAQGPGAQNPASRRSPGDIARLPPATVAARSHVSGAELARQVNPAPSLSSDLDSDSDVAGAHAEMEVGVAVRGLGFLVPGSPETMGLLHGQRKTKQRTRTGEPMPLDLGPRSASHDGKLPGKRAGSEQGQDLTQAPQHGPRAGGQAPNSTLWNWFGSPATATAGAPQAAAGASSRDGTVAPGATSQEQIRGNGASPAALPLPKMSRKDWETFLGLRGSSGSSEQEPAAPVVPHASPSTAPAPPGDAGLSKPQLLGAAASPAGAGAPSGAAQEEEQAPGTVQPKPSGAALAGPSLLGFPLSLFGTRSPVPKPKSAPSTPQKQPPELPEAQASPALTAASAGPTLPAALPETTPLPTGTSRRRSRGGGGGGSSVGSQRRSRRVVLQAPGETFSESAAPRLAGRGGQLAGPQFSNAEPVLLPPSLVRSLAAPPVPSPSTLGATLLGACTAECLGKQIVVYSISVQSGDGTSWIVHRRYRDFDLLQRRLKALPFGYGIPLTLPPKRIFASRFDPQFLLQRALDLNKYLKNLLDLSPEWNTLPETLNFLSASSTTYGADISTGVGVLRPLVTLEDPELPHAADELDPALAAVGPRDPGSEDELDGTPAVDSSSLPASRTAPAALPQAFDSLDEEGGGESEELGEGMERVGEDQVDPGHEEPEGQLDADLDDRQSFSASNAPPLHEVGSPLYPHSCSPSELEGQEGPGLAGAMAQDWAQAGGSRGGGEGPRRRAPTGAPEKWASVSQPGGRSKSEAGEARAQGSKMVGSVDAALGRELHGAERGSSAGAPSISAEEDDTFIPAELKVSKISAPLLNLVDVVFELHTHGWIRRQVVWAARQVLGLVMGDAIDDFLLSTVQRVRTEGTAVAALSALYQFLFPGGTFFTRKPPPPAPPAPASSSAAPRQQQAQGQAQQQVQPPAAPAQAAAPPAPPRPDPLLLNVPPQTYSERMKELEKSQKVRQLLLDAYPASVIRVIGLRRCEKAALDVHAFIQSPVFLKQLAHSCLELFTVGLFPELVNVVTEIRQGNL